MIPDFTDDELNAEIRRLTMIESACGAAGEADGLTAARSQRRALQKELQRRAG